MRIKIVRALTLIILIAAKLSSTCLADTGNTTIVVTSSVRSRIVRLPNVVFITVSLELYNLLRAAGAGDDNGGTDGANTLEGLKVELCDNNGEPLLTLDKVAAKRVPQGSASIAYELTARQVEVLRSLNTRPAFVLVTIRSKKFRASNELDLAGSLKYESKFISKIDMPSYAANSLMESGSTRSPLHVPGNVAYSLGPYFSLVSDDVLTTEAADTSGQLNVQLDGKFDWVHGQFTTCAAYNTTESFRTQFANFTGAYSRDLFTKSMWQRASFLLTGQLPALSISGTFIHYLQDVSQNPLPGAFSNRDLPYGAADLKLTSLFLFPKLYRHVYGHLSPDKSVSLDLDIGLDWFPNAKLAAGETVHRFEPAVTATINIPVHLLGNNLLFFRYESLPNPAARFVRHDTVWIGMRLFGAQSKLAQITP